MVHGVAADDGSLAVMVVDMRDPASEDAVPVEISAPTGLPDGAPKAWELTEGSRLTGEALDAQESRLTAPAEVAGQFAGAQLGREEPATVTSDPGSVTLRRFEPAEETEEAEEAKEAEPSDGCQ